MEEAKRVIVHGGMCHRDDFLVVGLLRMLGAIRIDYEHHHPTNGEEPEHTKVLRQNPSIDDLNDPKVIVADVGKQFNPLLNNWDHHQEEPEVENECAFSLLCKNTQVPNDLFSQDSSRAHTPPQPFPFSFSGTFHDLWKDAPWYRAVAQRDNMGPHNLAKKYGLDFMPPELFSPIDSFVLFEIGEMEEFSIRWIEFSADLLRSKVKTAVEFTKKMAWLKENAEFFVMIDDDPTKRLTMMVVDQKGAFGLNEYIAKYGAEDAPVGMTATRDKRDSHWKLWRMPEGEGIVDLSKLRDHKDVTYTNPRGFIAIVDGGYTPSELAKIAAETFI